MKKTTRFLIVFVLALVVQNTQKLFSQTVLDENFASDTNGIWMPQQSATYVVEEGYLKVDYPQTTEKYRTDLKAAPTDGVLIEYTKPYLAIRFTKPSTGNVILDTPLGSYLNAKNNYSTDFADKDVYYWNLQSGTFGSSKKSLPTDKDTTLTFLQFKVADLLNPDSVGYYVDFVKTFATYEEMQNEVNSLSDSTLSALTVSKGVLSPSFSSKVDTYNLVLPYNTSSVAVSGVPTYTYAFVNGADTIDVSAGAGTIKVEVLSRDSVGTMLYVINYEVLSDSTSGGFAYEFTTDVESWGDDGSSGAATSSNSDGQLVITNPSTFNYGVMHSDISYTSLNYPYLAIKVDHIPASAGDWKMGFSFSIDGTSYVWDYYSSVAINYGDSIFVWKLDTTLSNSGDLYIPGGNLSGGYLYGQFGTTTSADSVLIDWIRTYATFNQFENDVYGPSDVATLSTLTVSVGDLSPAFSSDVTSYTLSVPYGTSTVEVDARTTDANASVTGDGTINVSSGSATVSVVVTAEDLTTTSTYTIEITVSAPSTDATLSALTVSQGTLSPSFSSDVTSYTLSLPSGTTSVDVAATATDENASATGDGTIDLTSGSVTVSVVVTAEDGTTTKTYEISITVKTSSIENNSLNAVKAYSLNSQLVITNLSYNSDVSVFNLMGQIIYKGVAESSTLQRDVRPGIYIIVVSGAEGTATIKVICK